MKELPPKGATERERDFAINQLIRGGSNAVGSVTLNANSTTTVLTSPLFKAGGVALLFPQTANASIEVGNGTIRALVTAAGTVTITHASNSQTDRTFGFLVVGG